jgi:lactate dehydrogenase-like 2-hydroxyacid dehydrogenase
MIRAWCPTHRSSVWRFPAAARNAQFAHQQVTATTRIESSRIPSMKVFFYSAHSYDRDAFEAVTKPPGYEFTYHAASLEVANASIAEGSDAICIFVNDDCSAEVIEVLHEHGIKVVLLRCAGFNNVDLAAAKKYGMFVARVPGIA